LRFRVNILLDSGRGHSLPLVYNYYVYAFFLSHLAKTDLNFAVFIHDYGVEDRNLRFKFFTFSKITFDRYEIYNNILHVFSRRTCIDFSIQIPELYEKAVESFLNNLNIQIGSKDNFITGRVVSVIKLTDTLTSNLFYTEQPVYVTVPKKESSSKFYLNPWRHSNYLDILKKNILNKYRLFYSYSDDTNLDLDINSFDIEIQGLTSLKQELKGKGFSFYDEVKIADTFDIKYKALKTKYYKTSGYQYFFKINTDSTDLKKFIYTVGLGCNNSQGFGFVRSINE